jgi:hypothetical protein
MCFGDLDEIMKKCFLRLCGNVRKVLNRNFPNSVFYFNEEDTCLFEYNILSECLAINYQHIWLIITETFDISLDETEIFLKRMAKEHFNLYTTEVNKLKMPEWYEKNIV